MKKLENNEIELEFVKGEKIGFADLAKVCLNQIPEGGIPPLEMAKRVKVIDKVTLKVIGVKIDLEDAEFEILKKCADSTRWNLIHKDIVAFNEYLDKLNKK